jgi:hypothetical protein
MEKGTSKWSLLGAILFYRRHYTCVFQDGEHWVHYDTMSLPRQLSKAEAERMILEKGRCLLYHSS